MIAGIGQTHPNEVGMTFDYTLGIPYIPASSIKGVVRFTHTTSIIDKAIKSGKVVSDKFDDEEEWTNIPDLFGKGGNEGKRGKAIFLDAYPEKIPELKVDIMNPHYRDYYSDEKGTTAPTDNMQPNPIFFLAVDKNTKFIFRILIDKRCEKLLDTAKNALKEALTIYGIGAKTSVGYGIFEIEKWEESDFLKEEYKKYISEEEKKKKIAENERLKKQEELKLSKMSEVEKICYQLEKKEDENFANEIYKKIVEFENSDKIKIAESLKNFFKKIGKWEKGLSKKQKEKKRKIQQILGE
jgi:CRISPR-associated protein Cmr6